MSSKKTAASTDTSPKTPHRTRAARTAAARVALAKVEALKPADVLQDFTSLQISMGENVATLQASVTRAFRELDDLKLAVEAKEKQLRELHQLDGELLALDEAERQHVEALTHFALEKEERKRERDREEDDYTYQKRLRRRQEEDNWNREKAEREVEIARREEDLKGREQELTDLRDRVGRVEEETRSEVNRAVAVATHALEREHKHVLQLSELKSGSEVEAQKHSVGVLTAENQRLQEQVKELQALVNQANVHVKEIAAKAVEGAGAKQALEAFQHTMGPAQGARPQPR
jgi:myosin heavy subunit